MKSWIDRLSWPVITIIIGLPTLLSFIAWLIHILSTPEHWCSVTVGSAGTKVANSPINDCTSILLALIGWLGWALIALIACWALAWAMIIIRNRGVSIDVHGPGGIGFRAENDEPDPAAAGAEHVKRAAEQAADEVSGAPQ